MTTFSPLKPLILLTALSLGLGACGDSTQDGQVEPQGFAGRDNPDNPTPDSVFDIGSETITLRAAANKDRNAYFGDLHVHTAYSFDAFAFGTTATPYDAYRYARGEALQHPSGFTMKLREPLDFYAVTDHAMFLGAVKAAANPETEFAQLEINKELHNLNAPDNLGVTSMPQRSQIFSTYITSLLDAISDGVFSESLTRDISKTAWRDIVDAANLYNTPGEFTTFAAYEYTSATVDTGNLHRNVIFKDTETLPAVPFSRFHSRNPEGLWHWMDALREQGIESLAIPHNSNGSNGQMFKLTDWAGNPLDDAYAEQRMRNEPLVEITQIKGTSDTHPQLSTRDEWADFELMPFRVGTKLPSEAPGSYVRDAYLRGMSLQANGTGNPYKFGLVGASDTHVGATSDDEETYFSKAGLLDGEAELRGSVPASRIQIATTKMVVPDSVKKVDGENYLATSTFETWSAAGLAAVWAEENTRDAIYEAFRRKETFATTGPRIKVRFFAGYDYDDNMLQAADKVSKAYAGGVTMGSNLTLAAGKTPKFLLWATRDAKAAPLQRLQIIKGYVAKGVPVEKVYDVACSDGLQVNPQTQRCPDNGATVNLDDCSFSTDTGDAELQVLWEDPDFDGSQEAFYYTRVLENPTCRWSTWDALQAGEEPRSDLATTIQERAWSSPIWLTR